MVSSCDLCNYNGARVEKAIFDFQEVGHPIKLCFVGCVVDYVETERYGTD